ncbi:hypothetical protein LCGC14_1050710 [marine sediment metagenome]|uniref:Portal protein n=1 Tax=marine sediment metagenome TaxID=412755 RepID=A0A0F9MTC5_9ZZZZ
MSFNEVCPNKLLLGFLNIYIIPIGNKTIGRKINNLVNINDVIAIAKEINEAIQITNANLMLKLQGDDSTGEGSNEYLTHEEQVAEIISTYAAASNIGSDLVKRIVNVSAALKIPNGLDIEGGNNNSPERKYIQDFIDSNQLNEGVCTELSKEAEKQGQCLVNLLWDDFDNTVKINYMSWNKYKYIITPVGLNNMTAPYYVSWDEVNISDAEGETAGVTIPAGSLIDTEIAFVAFNKVINDDGSIEGFPSIGSILSRLDDISKDLVYWKKSNKLYAHPTPAVKIDDANEAESLTAKITASGWTMGQMLVSSGELAMVVPQNFHETIKEAILINLQLVSGATGLAISWLGFPDLMSNRAVADSLGEPLEIVAANDIASWKSFYEQMFDNVIEIRNTNIGGGTKLKTGIIKPRLKPMSDRIWQQLVRFWMPSAEKELISRESFHDKIPGFDIIIEEERLKKQMKEDDARKAMIKKKEAELSPNARDDIDQPNTGSVRFNETPG